MDVCPEDITILPFLFFQVIENVCPKLKRTEEGAVRHISGISVSCNYGCNLDTSGSFESFRKPPNQRQLSNHAHTLASIHNNHQFELFTAKSYWEAEEETDQPTLFYYDLTFRYSSYVFASLRGMKKMKPDKLLNYREVTEMCWRCVDGFKSKDEGLHPQTPACLVSCYEHTLWNYKWNILQIRFV